LGSNKEFISLASLVVLDRWEPRNITSCIDDGFNTIIIFIKTLCSCTRPPFL